MLSRLEKNINRRYLKVCENLRTEYQIKSKAALARMIKLHPQILSDYKVNKLKLSVKVLAITLIKFPHVNAGYILTGEGEMFFERYQLKERDKSLKEDAINYFQSIKEEDFEKIKIDFMITKSRNQAYENAFSLMGLKHMINE